MRSLWLLFTQTITVCLGIWFTVSTLRPEWVTAAVPEPDIMPTYQLAPAVAGSYAQAVRRAAPAVVNIYTSQRLKPAQRPYEGGWQGAEPNVDDAPSETNLGSGVIVHQDGLILTNNHVLNAIDKVELALADGRRASAELVGRDPDSDIAVLRVSLPDLPVIPLYAAPVHVGDVVLAIGNPFGVGQTTTQGIVSGLGRSRLGVNLYENFIQTDAAINPGNSGGALIDVQGRLVGINTAMYSETGGSLGIGFAIPAPMALAVLHELVSTGVVSRGWLGIEPQDLSPDLVQAFGLPSAQGAIVARVLRQSPAAGAGLQVGDIVQTLDGQTVDDSIGLLTQIAALKAGSRTSLQVWRDGKSRTIKVTVGQRPAAQPE
ncbi:S1C family serine protease [Alcaligenes endophyticus]|uniref:Trypsin-like peptidase domain-containing protein n=1 Tax=Alcaligenes endophyticus TaxID=1929088 RepID=A0ABT8EFA5_9BURK|nr:trypsin-like peptidase domain-containing protein [Alcaligenes endophyticus]MCX5590373.1 trypsin-like peptidase domain-containing protein [Alcaligenes endophyticus]MDN4119963.1 trypsin-like peptidase domain-containing protein [Alcaligenes endophyticus]